MGKVVCLFGDSVTWGSFDPEFGGWAGRLRGFFEVNGGFVYNCGVCGDSSRDVLKRFVVEASSRDPDVIVFSIGLNDTFLVDGKVNVSLVEFEENLKELVDKGKSFTDDIVFLGLFRVDESLTNPVSWDDSISYKNDLIVEYNEKLKDFCGKNGLKFVDLMDLIGSSDLKDGVHPCSEGHNKIFLRVKEFLF